MFEDTFPVTPGKVTVAQVTKSLDRAQVALGDGRWGYLRSERVAATGKGKATLTIIYGNGGRALDASALAYELNN